MIETRDIEDVYPLSPLQEGLLFHTLQPGQGGLYATQLTCRLRGLDVPSFERAWRTVVNRHPSLRSAFVWKSTQRPLQAVARKVGLPFHHEDWRGLAADELEPRLRAFLAEDRSRELQPSRAPLMRLSLLRTGDDTHQLVWTTHHLILDGWCRAPILQEVFTLYAAGSQGRDTELPPARPYRDYVAWLQRQDLAEIEAFWRSKLRGVAERTPVHALPAGRGEGTGEQEIELSAAAAGALHTLAQRHRLTLGSVVHGAWALLLFRYSGRRDVVFGTVVSGRPPALDGVESIVGLFANTLPVRVRGEDALRAADWLRSVQAELVEQRQYEHSPLAQVQKWSELGPGQPLFDTLVVFQNYPGEEVLARLVDGLGIDGIRSFEQASYPLTLVVVPGTVWRLQLGYDRRRFSDLAVARMLDHYRRLLEGLATGLDRPLPDLPLLAESESAQLLREWNDTAAPIARRRVHEMIAERAAMAPDRPAVVWDGGAWSFQTLDRRANQLARYLRHLGIGPESVVAVLAADRCPELPLSVLGALKAGAAFLALDAGYPRERLAYMLADAGCRVLLTQGDAAETLVRDGLQRIALDRDWEEIGGESAEPLEETGGPDSLAYVFYTSGSTGRPKGVAVSHAAFLSFAGEMARRLRLTPADRMLQFASPAFDVLVEELFPVWLHGGAVALLPPETLGDPRGLGTALERLGVSVAELPAVYWHQWVDELVSGGATLPRSLRLLLLGAEKPSPERLAAWRRFSVPLIYVFGLTETAVTNTLFEVPADHEGELPIGRPVANTRLYVLDLDGRPVPAGVPGELFIGGEGVARGYLGRPELTAQRFVPDPWSGLAGARLYRTGDLARHCLDGNLDFLGRIDDQVKVRGIRIEPGEVEALLRQHPAIREAVVIVREDQPGDRRLVGYVLAAGGPVSERELRAFLADRLPDPLVPSAFVALDAWPVTPSGKVDRRALPAPEPRTVEDGCFVEPRTALERLLAEIWQGVLGVERIGVHDNFFELGGDSILSIRVASAAHRRGYELAPWQLFQEGTIARLAQVVGVRATPRMAAPSAAGPVPLTPIQHWFFERSLPEPAHWNMPVLLAPREPVAPEVLEAVLARLVERHDALRLRFLRRDGGWLQEVAPAVGALPFGRIDLSALPAHHHARALEEAAGLLQASLDLAVAPLLRAAWFDLGSAAARLLLVAHHLVVDGVSWHVLADDLETGCRQLRRGEPLDLPAATTPFARWAERLAEHARTGVLDRELAGWRAQQAARPPALPLDFEDGTNLEAAARSLTISLAAEETRSLVQEVPRAYRAHVNDLLVTALLEALRGWTGSHRLLVDLEGHGREGLFPDVDLSRTVGWFTTLAPLWLELPEVGGPGDDLRAVKEQLRAMAGSGLGFGLLRYLGSEGAAELRAAPRPEVLFNYMGQIGAPAAEPSLFALADEPMGPAVSPRGERSHLVEVNARVQGGRLEVRWTWSEGAHRRATIESLAESFVVHLRGLVAHCLSSGERGVSPSDFPLAGVDAAALKRLAAAVRGEIEDLYPLSPMQKGMLFHSLFEPGEGVYVAQLVFELQERVNVVALRGAWDEVLRRHPALRTAFFWEELSDPLQAVVRSVELPWSEEDWSALPEPLRIESLGRYLAADRALGFELSQAPLLRLARLRTGEAASWLVLSLHQILLDGWSLPLLFEDLFSLYEAAIRGAGVWLEDRPPYRHYVEWLRHQNLDAAEAYWRQALRGFDTPTPFGLDSPDPVAEVAGGGQGEARIVVPRDLTEGLLALARGRQLTYGILLQGAWALLLSRYSGEEDVLFGAVVSGRPAELPGVESMIGLFINTLPVRVQISPLAPWPSWIDSLQRQQIEVHRFEHAPLADVQRWSEVPAGQPLFSSLLIVQNYPLDQELGRQTGGLGIRKLRSADQTNYPLTIIVQPGAELHVTALYDRRRFHGFAVRRLLEHLRAILEGFVALPPPRLAEMPLLSAAERHQLLHEWNDTRTADVDDVPLHQLVRIQAEKTPDTVAVTSGDEQLSYRELDRRSDLLAAYLMRTGIEPGEPAGLCLERSLEMMIGLLGILKAGGAYLPLDPDYPALRLASLIRGARLRVVVANGRASDHPALQGLRVVRLDSDWPVIARGGVAPHAIDMAPESPAYVIYTSGSTGEPKGAVNAHRAVCNRIRWMQETYRLTDADRVLQKTPFGFDVSVWELFWPLVTGARLGMARPGGHRDTAYLRDTIRDLGITTLHFVPSMLHAFLEESGIEECTSLQRVLCSGETLAPDLAVRFSRRLGAELHNLYGPTEAAVDVTFWACAREDRPQNVPIGRPIANTSIHLLDRELRPVPCAIAGELYIGGRAVGRGYLGKPALTAERFVPDPFGDAPGARLYRTGDLVRRRADGALEFLGRLDHQVKIRGFRIELGEIEAAIGQHPGVREAAVVAREERPGRSILVAYFVPAGSQAPSSPALRAFLEERLPAPMVPALYVEMSALPLSPNGKLDRRALPAPVSDVAIRETYEEARTPAEASLAAIWEEVLGVERVGIHDNFFELGGDSILSILVVTRAARAGVKLTPKRLFERPTIAQLAADAEGCLPPVSEQGTVTGEIPLTPIQRWFLEQEPPEPHHFNQSVLLEMKQPVAPVHLDRAFAAVLAHHDALRLRFVRQEREWRQHNAATEPGNVFTQVDLSGLAPDGCETAARAASADLQAGLDLAHGPLLRAALFRLGPGLPDRLLITIHHLAVDAVSWRFLLEDLMQAQEQAARGEPVALPAKTTSFKTWAERLAAHASSEPLQSQLSEWLSDERSRPARLPVDFPGVANRAGSLRSVWVTFAADETDTLLRTAAAAYGVQAHEILLTALGQTLGGWLSSGTVLLDIEGHGREEVFEGVDLSRTVGWFTTIYPLRLELDRGDGPGEVLKAVKEQVRRIRELGLAYGLLRYLGGEASAVRLRGQPSAEVLFNYLGRIDRGTEASSLFSLSREIAGGTSPRTVRRHLLAVDGFIASGCLEVEWSYSQDLYRRSTIQQLADSFAGRLRALLEHCRSPEAGGYSPSDFGLAELKQQQLDRLARKYQRKSV